MKPPARRRLWCASGRVRGLPGGMVGAFLSKTTSCRETDRGRRRGPSRGPRPLRRSLRALRRHTGPVAERWCVLGTFHFKPKRAQKELKNAVQVALGALCRTWVKGASQAVAQARRALRHVCSREARPICRPRPRRPKSEYPFGTCALQTRRPRPDFNCGGPANTAATACSSRGASSPATGARRRRTRLGWIRTRRFRRRGRPRGASRTSMI